MRCFFNASKLGDYGAVVMNVSSTNMKFCCSVVYCESEEHNRVLYISSPSLKYVSGSLTGIHSHGKIKINKDVVE